MRTVAAAATDIGHVREGNEDAYLVAEPLYVVADGMGGHLGGEVASRLAVETLERLSASGEGTLAERIREANRVIFERSVTDRTVAGMGTTLTAALVEQGRAHLAHVGDSRAYRLREDRLEQLTHDHTLVQRMVEEGELTTEQAEGHPHRNILTRVLGGEPSVDVDELDVDLRVGDRLLLCSDGLTGMIADDRIAQILREEPDPHRAARRLIDEANDAGGVDNITVLLIDVVDDDPEPSPSSPATRTIAGPPERAAEASPPPRRRGVDARRALVWAGVVLGVLVLASVGLRLYLDSQWYVGVSDGRVAVFRGIPAQVAGFELHHVVVETSIPATDAMDLALYRDLDEGITADDRAEAEAVVEQIREDLARAGGAVPQEPAP